MSLERFAILLDGAPAGPSAEVVNVQFADDVPFQRRLQILGMRGLALEDFFVGLPVMVARVPRGRTPANVGERLIREFPDEVVSFGLEYH
jgi:hypothetical protein